MDAILSAVKQNLSQRDFLQKLTIINKQGKKQALTITEEQETILNSLEAGNNTLILKPRQIGSSTLVMAYLFTCAFYSEEPVTYAILSYKLESSKQLLKIVKNFYHSLPKALQRPLESENTTEIKFKDGGRIIAAAATQQGGLRSFTASKIVLSEFAFADSPDELKATALGALNDGQLIIESTANFYGDCLHQEIRKWEQGVTDWTYLFFPWWDHKAYRLDATDFTPNAEEKVWIEEGVLDVEQAAWRRKKISLLGLEKFKREFPTSLDEAYQIIGDTYFSYADFANVEIIDGEPEGEWLVLAEPDPTDSYAIGVDIGAGIGRDYSVIFCLSKKTYSPVLIWRSNEVSPVDLAEVIQNVSTTYNDALTLVEANNYGHATLNELQHIGHYRVWKDEKGADFLTTGKTKPLIFEELKKLIQNGFIKSLDPITIGELRTIGVDPLGKIKFADSKSGVGHSDSAMALALATWCLKNVRIKQKAYLPDWIIGKRSKRVIEESGARIGKHRRY
jgi:hypothetical protein